MIQISISDLITESLKANQEWIRVVNHNPSINVKRKVQIVKRCPFDSDLHCIEKTCNQCRLIEIIQTKRLTV